MADDYRKYECIVCGFIYDEAEGLPDEGIPPGTRWEDLPEEECDNDYKHCFQWLARHDCRFKCKLKKCSMI